jgi:hypothetical protein
MRAGSCVLGRGVWGAQCHQMPLETNRHYYLAGHGGEGRGVDPGQMYIAYHTLRLASLFTLALRNNEVYYALKAEGEGSLSTSLFCYRPQNC